MHSITFNKYFHVCVESIILDYQELQERDSRPIIQHAPEICMLVEDKLFQRIVSFL
jgi:hypothetical protein